MPRVKPISIRLRRSVVWGSVLPSCYVNRRVVSALIVNGMAAFYGRGLGKGGAIKKYLMAFPDERVYQVSGPLMEGAPCGEGMVAEPRIELGTRGFSIRCSTD